MEDQTEAFNKTLYGAARGEQANSLKIDLVNSIKKSLEESKK